VIRFFVADRSVEVPESDARGLAAELRKFDTPRLTGPKLDVDLTPGDALAAATLIENALETGRPAEPNDGEAGAIWRLLSALSPSTPLPQALLELRSGLAEQLGGGETTS
jgi:hypothetical protein